MKLHRLGKSLFAKSFTGKFINAALATATLSGLLFFAAAPGAKADNDDHNHRRFHQSERHYTRNDRTYYNQQYSEPSYQPQYEYRRFSERYDRDDRNYGRNSRNHWNRDRDDDRWYDRNGDRDRR